MLSALISRCVHDEKCSTGELDRLGDESRSERGDVGAEEMEELREKDREEARRRIAVLVSIFGPPCSDAREGLWNADGEIVRSELSAI